MLEAINLLLVDLTLKHQINLQNQKQSETFKIEKEEKCFIWSILAKLYTVEHGNNPCRVTKYEPYEFELNMTYIDYTVKIETNIYKINKDKIKR